MRLIDADALEKWTEEWLSELSGRQFLSGIRNSPTIDAAPVVRGTWVEFRYENYHIINCSACGKLCLVSNDVPYCDWIRNRNYCEVCGANMKGEENDG